VRLGPPASAARSAPPLSAGPNVLRRHARHRPRRTPCAPVSETIPASLPQRKLTATAAAGYSSYGNQIGLATGQVDEIYHPGYAAKAWRSARSSPAAPRGTSAGNVLRRETRDPAGRPDGTGRLRGPLPLLQIPRCRIPSRLRRGRPEGQRTGERKLQRLFRNPEAARLIKRCNDFGAGGVSVPSRAG
jgi:phosphoribosylformylglycinamidine synthase